MMKYISYILITLTLTTNSFAQEIEGFWQEAIRGCGLELTTDQIENLYGYERDNFFARSNLELFDGHYFIERSNGYGCEGRNHLMAMFYTNKPEYGGGAQLYCTGNVSSSGTYNQISSNLYEFHGTSDGGHAYGFTEKTIKIEVIGNVLKTTNPDLGCPNLIKYFVLFPLS